MYVDLTCDVQTKVSAACEHLILDTYSTTEWVDGLPGGHSLRGAERPHNGGREEQQARGAKAQRFAAREQDTRNKE
jgi:hypothetical protein